MDVTYIDINQKKQSSSDQVKLDPGLHIESANILSQLTPLISRNHNQTSAIVFLSTSYISLIVILSPHLTPQKCPNPPSP